MIKDKVKRSLCYNVTSEPDPVVHHWTFLIVNTIAETEVIKGRIRQVLQPTDLERTLTTGIIPQSGLHYTALTLDSFRRDDPNKIDIEEIYKGHGVKRDPRLGSHRTIDGLANYVNKMFS